MEAAREIEQHLCGFAQAGREPVVRRRLRFRGKDYVLVRIGSEERRRIAEEGGAAQRVLTCDPSRCVAALAVATAEAPDDLLGFYCVCWTDSPDRFDDTMAFVSPRARGRHLSALLIYGVYLELLELERPFVLCEIIDHPLLKLHARCGFAPPVRALEAGKVELGRFDLHSVLSRIESENDLRILG